jgi:glycosyltransferase involved in cell wall biosynthesis
MIQISVVVPTYRRPDALAEAARSVFAQDCLDRFEVELVVVDNDPLRSADRVMAELRAEATMPLIHARAPSPGVANARNAGLAVCLSPLVAFLDDDEVASPGWLSALVEAQQRFDADVVFGPVRASLPEGAAHRAFLEGFFSRQGPAETALTARYWGCGDSLVRRAALPKPEPFDPDRNLTGGEDDLLFQTLARAGARFAWSAEAVVFEHPDPDRQTLGYALKRGFAYGQGPASAAYASGPMGWPAIPLWMGWGLLQALAYGALSLCMGSERRPFALDRAARGLGKLLWFPPFKLRFYGAH